VALDKGAFPLVEQMTGVHTSAHIDATQFLLKLGLPVMLLLYASFFNIFRKGIRSLHDAVSLEDKWALLGCTLMLVIFGLNFIYFERLSLFLGFAIAGITYIRYSLGSDTK
jgi:drug/metabolite transporter (DMT)-like permease